MKWKNAMTGDGNGSIEDSNNNNNSSASHNLPPGFFDKDNVPSAPVVLGKRDNAEIDLDDL